MASRCDTIGVNYSELRKPDPRIGAMIGRAPGAARKVSEALSRLERDLESVVVIGAAVLIIVLFSVGLRS